MTTQADRPFTWDKDAWTSLNEMVEGFDEYRPALSGALVGQTLELHCTAVGVPGSEHVLAHTFSEDRLTWTVTGAAGEERGEAAYELFEMQPGLFFLHYLREEADHPTAVTLALDVANGVATGAVGELGLEPNPHRARQQWFRGRLASGGAGGAPDGAGAAPLHEPTEELIGHRLRYAYSSDDVYDHVYLNRNLFTWLCVGGAEAGLGDTDACTYWKLREKTYLFSWLEKNVGVEGMVLIDLGAMRTVGIQFGLDQLTGDVVNLTMGAYARHLGFAPGVGAECPGPAVRS